MIFERHSDDRLAIYITYLIWGFLTVTGLFALVTGRWSVAFVSLATLCLTFLPLLLQSWSGVRIPTGFIAAIIFFIMASLFLGEVGDFYERLWWWDVFLHSFSAIGFGMIGTVLILMMVESERLEASAFLAAFFAFCFGIAIGAIWEIFEYWMDQIFGLNMQKSGLVDTMYDLMVDCLGAAIGASAGYAYLKGSRSGFLTGPIARFIHENRWMFSRRPK